MRNEKLNTAEYLVGRLSFFRRQFLHAETDFEADLMEWFGLNPGQARLLVALYEANGPVRMTALTASTKTSHGSLNKYIPRIREALGKDSVEVSRGGETYQLTKAGRAECDKAKAEVSIESLRQKLGI